MQTACLIIFFNRLDTTQKVLEAVLKAGCKKLFLYCDGGRNEKETELLATIQLALIQIVPSNIEVVSRFEKVNKGPRLAVGEAITWFFKHVELGIILEHDCLPHPDFFPFCENLLERYKDDERVMHISGDNFQFGRKRGNASYYFSRLNHIWGFATWKRAWDTYDVHMKDYPEFKKSGELENILRNKRMRKIWSSIFDSTYSEKIQTWDYQWTFAIWKNNGLAILPQVNLVSNIGFDAGALNTTNPNHALAAMKTFPLGEITHPQFMVPNQTADEFSTLEVFNPTIGKFAISQLKRKLGKS